MKKISNNILKVVLLGYCICSLVYLPGCGTTEKNNDHQILIIPKIERIICTIFAHISRHSLNFCYHYYLNFVGYYLNFVGYYLNFVGYYLWF